MQTERLDFSQPANDLTAIADLQRKSLIVKNDYKNVNPYSSQILMPFLMVMNSEKGQVYF